MKRAFDHCVDDYARHRPSYPSQVGELIASVISESSTPTIADVGAGTGIFARQLARPGWRMIAIDPSDAMLVRGRGDDPSQPIRAVCAAAEQLPLADSSVEAITAAQAFHWFNPPYALADFARVLKTHSPLFLIWNNRDYDRSPFVRAYESLIKRFNPSYEREYRQQDWAGKIADSSRFESTEHVQFEHHWRLSAEDLVGFSRSTSYIRNVLSQRDRMLFEAELRTMAGQYFDGLECDIPLKTDVWFARCKS